MLLLLFLYQGLGLHRSKLSQATVLCVPFMRGINQSGGQRAVSIQTPASTALESERLTLQASQGFGAYLLYLL